MRVTFERTGGFAGRKLRARIDTSTLPRTQEDELCRLIAESGFFALPGRLEPAAPQPDRFQYVLTVDTGENSHTVFASESSVPQSMRPLLNWLSRYR